MKHTIKSLVLLAVISCFSSQLWSQCGGIIINEIHYDNVSGDVMEFIEVAVPVGGGLTLSEYSLDLYNGSGGASYDTKTLDQFTLGNSDASYDYYTYTYPTNGIQNGGPDGMALSNNSTMMLCEFLSYEGTFTATSGPADMVMSTDIGVSEPGAIGESLQLIGGSWTGPVDDTPGDTNMATCAITGVGVTNETCNGTSFEYDVTFTVVGGSGTYEVIDVTNGNAILGSGSSSPITISIPNNTSTTTFDIDVWDQNDNLCLGGTGVTVNPQDCSQCEISGVGVSNPMCTGMDFTFDVAFSSNNASGTFEVIDVTNGNAILGSGTTSPITVTIVGNTSTTPFSVDVWDQNDNLCLGGTGVIVNPLDCSNPPSCEGVIINEIHYDNDGTDTGEFIEVAVPVGASIMLSDFTVTLYNGSNGESYNSETLDLFNVGMTDANYTYYTSNFSSIQNGGPDGMALSVPGLLCEFLSYEGTMTATDGPADMVMSTDIGVSEPGAVGESLQLVMGSWVGPTAETPGDTNMDNTCPASLMLTGTISTNEDYETSGDITSDQIIQASAVVDYDAVTEINMVFPFEVQLGAVLDAFIDGCNGGMGGSN